ncbi:MAG: DNA repair protein RecN, partial [Bacteroidales bacterium]|nr:DNA repair protein RecN [Bacteroidales bacterium]
EMQKTLSKRLAQMNMPHGRVEILLHSTSFNEYGEDEADFLFSANAGIPPQPLAKIASGGEMSRVMLAVKALISQKNVLPTILFDEIDSGVSGEVSTSMADVMRDIAAYSQVIAITHQAQIAAKADAQYLVYKETTDNTTCSKIRQLKADERRNEIARMIGDGALTDASLRLADLLLEHGSDKKKAEHGKQSFQN